MLKYLKKYLQWIIVSSFRLFVDSEMQWNGCIGLNKTAYVPTGKQRAEVKLDNGDIAKFPPGEYEFQRSVGPDVCTYYLVITSKGEVRFVSVLCIQNGGYSVLVLL